MPRFFHGKPIDETNLVYQPKRIFDIPSQAPRHIAVKVIIELCTCSVCGHKTLAVAGTKHEDCRGIKLVRPLPTLFQDLHNPEHKGTFLNVEEKGPVQLDR